MAARVNVKFVVSLAVIVAVVFIGVAMVFVYVTARSGDNYVRMGEAAMARQDYAAADAHFARAVGKQSGNIEWLRRWREAREHKIPETASAYQQDYAMYVMGILRTLATAQRTNVEAHREYLDALYRERALGAGREAWDMLINEAESAMAYFDPEQPAELRRYRGLAVAALVDQDLLITEERRLKGREDLEAALALDPTDSKSAVSLAAWHRAAAAQTGTGRDEEGRAAHREASGRVLADLLRAAPGDALVVVEQLAMEVDDIDRMEEPLLGGAETARQKARALTALRPRVAEVHEQIMQADPADLSFRALSRFYAAAMRISPEDVAAMTRAVVDRALEANPDSADLLSLRANSMLMQGDVEGALSQFQRVAELPNLPISLDGIRLWEVRRRARFLQATIAVGGALQLEDPVARQEALERAREYRRELARHMSESSPEMLFIDGKLRFADGDISGAQRALAEFVRSPGAAAAHMAEALLMLADCAMRRQTPGLAREYLQQVQELRPTATEILMALARLESSLQNTDQAERIFEQILGQHPDHQEAREQLQLLRALHRGDRVDDPIMQRLIEADRLARGDEMRLGDEGAAITLLSRSLATHDYDPRIVSALVQLKLLRDDKVGALRTLDEAIARRPDDARLTETRRGIEAVGSLELTLKLIDETDAPDLEKWLSRHRLYMAHEKLEDAKAALERAAGLAPDDARIVEMQFVDAVQRRDMAKATAIADRAARLDTDRADGDTYRARLQLAEDNPRQAVITLQRAAERGNASAALFRLMGLTQLQLGRTADAIASLRRALDLAPHDLATIKTLTAALIQSNQQHEALAVARGSEAHARRDPSFLNMWLSLEAGVGNIAFARERREQMASRDPDDRDNLAALAELYIAEQKFDRARRVIDTLRESGSIRIVALDARWHADRGDLEQSRRIFEDHIARLRETGQLMGPDAHMVYGQFMLQRGQTELGLAAMREAARHQQPGVRDVEVRIGDVLLTLGRLGEAEQTYRAVLEAGIADEGHRIRKRLIESMVQQSRFAEAEREFAGVTAGIDDDIELLVLRAEVARGLGDVRRAREVLDRTVARFPDEPMGYLRRARLLMADPDLTRDALADLSTALRLRPGMWQALRMRAAIHMADGRSGDAVRDIIALVEANPDSDDLRLDAIARLLRHGHESEAAALARDAASLRSGNSRLLTMLGNTFAQHERWRASSQFYRQAWEINSGDEGAAVRYAQALINAVPEGSPQDPQLAEAQRVLATPALNTDQSIDLLMTRAALRRKQGRAQVARADALLAFNLVGNDPRLLLAWHDRLRQVYGDAQGMLTVLDAAPVPASLQQWHPALRGMVMITERTMREEGISTLRNVAAEATDPNLRRNTLGILSTVFAEDEKWDEALDVTRQGLDMAADDVMLNNNAAYFLYKLGRPRDGLPFAEKAAERDPGNRTVLDTLAAIQRAVGENVKAVQTLQGALRVTRTDADRASTAIKLGGWMLEDGDRVGASGMGQLARELITDMGEAGASLRPQLDQFARELQQGR